MAEQVYRRGGQEWRPFSLAAGVKCRGYSLGWQRALVDFGADEAFEGAAEKVKEHYGVEVPVSAIRVITLRHAEQMKQERELDRE